MKAQANKMRRGRTCIAIAFLLTTCAMNPASAEPATDGALDAAISDYQRTVGEAVIVHMAGGCLTGALMGFLGGGHAGAIRGCAVGAGAGGVVGVVDGTRVAEAKKAYAEKEKSLDQSIADARARNEKLKGIVALANGLVARRRAELAALKSQGGGDTDARRKVRDALSEEIRLLDVAIAKARDDEAKLKGMADELRGTKTAPAAVSALSGNRASARALEAKRRELDKLRAAA